MLDMLGGGGGPGSFFFVRLFLFCCVQFSFFFVFYSPKNINPHTLSKKRDAKTCTEEAGFGTTQHRMLQNSYRSRK